MSAYALQECEHHGSCWYLTPVSATVLGNMVSLELGSSVTAHYPYWISMAVSNVADLSGNVMQGDGMAFGTVSGTPLESRIDFGNGDGLNPCSSTVAVEPSTWGRLKISGTRDLVKP